VPERATASEREEPTPPASRAFWSGTVSFGLVSIPVGLFPANRSGLTLRMLASDGTPVARRYACSVENRLLEPDEIVRGYEVRKGRYVVVTDEELDALEPRRSRDIDLRQFVRADELDPLYFERAYYLAPAGQSTKAYTLLAAVMQDTGRAGIATFVMRGKEYLVAIMAEDGILRAVTLRFHDEVRKPADVDLEDAPKRNPLRVKRFAQAIAKLGKGRFDPRELGDTYAARVAELAAKKRARGQDVVEAVEVGEEEDDRDLVEALRSALRPGSRRTGAAKRPAARRRKTAGTRAKRGRGQKRRAG
jgi:DNA end-binding protein Ku